MLNGSDSTCGVKTKKRERAGEKERDRNRESEPERKRRDRKRGAFFFVLVFAYCHKSYMSVAYRYPLLLLVAHYRPATLDDLIKVNPL